MKDLRRIVATVVIGSFSLAALMGIAALLGAGEFGETEGRILATTVAVGLESMAVLCYLALAGRPYAWVGGVGAAVSAVAFLTTLDLIWLEGDALRLWGSTAIVAATFAQMSLLLALSAGRGRDGLLWPTLAAVAVLAAMLVGPIVNESFPEDDGYWRLLGVVAILDVLGTVVLIALGSLSAVARSVAAPDRTPTAPVPTELVIDRAVRERIDELARQRQVSPAQVVTEALDEYFARR